MAAPKFYQDKEITYIADDMAKRNPFLTREQQIIELPKFEDIRHRLPHPYWRGHESTIDCYWKAWKLAFGNLRNPIPGTKFVSPFIDAAFNGCTFMWDSCFMLMFGKYAHAIFNFQKTLDNFYSHQHRDGFISREINENDDSEKFTRHDPASTGPNVMPWCEWEYFLLTGDKERLSAVFPPLMAYHRWLRHHRTWPDGSYWSCGWGCGMDNQPRLEDRENLYAQTFHHGHMVWVDACMQQHISCNVLIDMANVLGCPQDAADMVKEREELRALINGKLWDEGRQFYHDLWRTGERSYVKSIGSYWALLADVVPQERLPGFIAHLENEKEFNRPNRIPTLSADDRFYREGGDYWLGGVWAPTNYMVLTGLTRCGYDALAHEIAVTALRNVVRTFEDTGTLWENYAPEYAGRGERSKGDFVGWSGLFPIAMLFEHVFGIRINAEKKELTWHVSLTEEFGVEQLPFGTQGQLSLHCAARSSNAEKPQITVHSDTELTLTLLWGNGEQETIHIQPE